MTEETPYKNQPDLERSGKMGTEETSSSRQEIPLRTWQCKCTKDGQTFSSQIELNNHYRAVHGMQGSDQQEGNNWSSSNTDKIPSPATKEEMTDESDKNTENEKSQNLESEELSENWDKTSQNKNWSMKENNESSNVQNSEYGKVSQNQMQDLYKCQKDGQIFSNQEELDQHNKKIHNIEPKEFGTVLEEDEETND